MSPLHCIINWEVFYIIICPMLSHAGTVVLEWFKDNNASQWKSGKFDPCSLRNPWTDRHLNLHGWLRRGPLPLCKISSRYDYPRWPSKPNMQKCASSDSASFLVLPTAYSQDPCTDFHDQYVKWRSFVQECAFWGSRKHSFTFNPIFPPKRKLFFGQNVTVLRSNIIFFWYLLFYICELADVVLKRRCKLLSFLQ